MRRLAGYRPVAAVQVELALLEVARTAVPVVSPVDAKPLSPINLRRKRPSLFAARLRCVARLNGRKGRKPALRGRYSKNATPRPAALAATAKKRSPNLFPVKRQAIKPKRATTRIIDTTPKRKSAIIIRFPGKTVERVRRAA